MKNNKGITLIALVITIIVLLILAGITIAMLTGENGILTNATKSKAINELGAAKDLVGLKANEALTDYFESTYVSSTTAKYSNAQVQSKISTEVAKLTWTNGVSMAAKPTDSGNENKIKLTYGDYEVYGAVNYNGSLTWGEAKHKNDIKDTDKPTPGTEPAAQP